MVDEAGIGFGAGVKVFVVKQYLFELVLLPSGLIHQVTQGVSWLTRARRLQSFMYHPI
jgi:hypothetical protein